MPKPCYLIICQGLNIRPRHVVRSKSHENKAISLCDIDMAPGGFEPPTPGLKGRCSNQAEL
jgi:hypothetical protein